MPVGDKQMPVDKPFRYQDESGLSPSDRDMRDKQA
jgi:hypothetical protein